MVCVMLFFFYSNRIFPIVSKLEPRVYSKFPKSTEVPPKKKHTDINDKRYFNTYCPPPPPRTPSISLFTVQNLSTSASCRGENAIGARHVPKNNFELQISKRSCVSKCAYFTSNVLGTTNCHSKTAK